MVALTSPRPTNWMPLLSVFLVFSVLVIPPIVLGVYGPQQASDMLGNHLPQVNTFLRAPFALFEYPATAAPTPGQHIVLAWLAKMLGYDVVQPGNLPIRFANAAFGYLVLFAAWRIFQLRCRDGWRAAALTLPLACSSYVVFAAIWIATDNGAFLFYELTVAVAAFGAGVPLVAIAVGIGLVMWRQMYLPVAGTFGLLWLLQDRRLRDFAIAALAAAAPCALMAVYYVTWHGLTPPQFQHFNGFGYGVAGPLSALALFGMLLPFYVGYLHTALRTLLGTRRALLAVLTCAVAALWLIGPTTHDVPAGRWGGVLWTLAEATPAFGAHSPIVLILAWVGAVAVAAIAIEARRMAQLPIELLALGLYLVGYSLQIESFQRYIEAQVFFTFGFASTRVIDAWRRAWLGPVGIAALFGTLAALRAYGVIGQVFD